MTDRVPRCPVCNSTAIGRERVEVDYGGRKVWEWVWWCYNHKGQIDR